MDASCNVVNYCNKVCKKSGEKFCRRRARTRLFCSGQSGTTTAQLQSITQKRRRFTRCHKATGSCGSRQSAPVDVPEHDRRDKGSTRQNRMSWRSFCQGTGFCLQLSAALQDCRSIGLEFLQVRCAAWKCFATVVRAPCLSLEQMLQRCHI